MRKLLAVLALSISATAYASPSQSSDTSTGTQTQITWTQSELQALDTWLDQFGEQFEDWFYSTWGAILGITDPDSGQTNGNPSGGGTFAAAPEFDPASALAALTLLSGGLAVLRGRRSKRED